MAKKILWVSHRHPHPREIDALREMYGGNVVVERETRPFDDARQIAQRFREGRYDDMVIVAQPFVIAVLCYEGIRMLWSASVEENEESRIDFRGARGQGFRFVRFRRIKRIAVEFEN